MRQGWNYFLYMSGTFIISGCNFRAGGDIGCCTVGGG